MLLAEGLLEEAPGRILVAVKVSFIVVMDYSRPRVGEDWLYCVLGCIVNTFISYPPPLKKQLRVCPPISDLTNSVEKIKLAQGLRSNVVLLGSVLSAWSRGFQWDHALKLLAERGVQAHAARYIRNMLLHLVPWRCVGMHTLRISS